MRIYIASSWKNETVVLALSHVLRKDGFEVDCFTDASTGRFIFPIAEIQSWTELNAKEFLAHPMSQRAFEEDKKWLNWCDCCLLVLPAGNSAHIEAGYAKGRGKKLIVYSPEGFKKGKYDVMYGFADVITDSYKDIICLLEE